MKRFPRDKALLALTVVSLVLSAFILLMTTDTIANVSAVETSGIGVYWDSSCVDMVSSIDWGALQPGSEKIVTVYVRNEGNESTFLTMTTRNWNPPTAPQHMSLDWDYGGKEIDPGEVLRVTKTLSVSPYIREITSFSFDILMIGQHFEFDLNFDGIVDIYDLVTVALAYGADPGHPRWDPLADINDDDIVDIFDLIPLAINLDKSISVEYAYLSIDSSNPVAPSVPFVVDGLSYNPIDGRAYLDGPANVYPLESGLHSILWPSPWTNPTNGITYFFSRWEDGSTDNPRTVDLEPNTTYEFSATLTEGPTPEIAYLVIRSNNPSMPDIPFTVDGLNTSPLTGEAYMDGFHTYQVTAGDHSIAFPLEWYSDTAIGGNGLTYYFQQWDDGVSDNPRTVTFLNGQTVTLRAVLAEGP